MEIISKERRDSDWNWVQRVFRSADHGSGMVLKHIFVLFELSILAINGCGWWRYFFFSRLVQETRRRRLKKLVLYNKFDAHSCWFWQTKPWIIYSEGGPEMIKNIIQVPWNTRWRVGGMSMVWDWAVPEHWWTHQCWVRLLSNQFTSKLSKTNFMHW